MRQTTQEALREEDVVAILPDKQQTFDMMAVTKVLSTMSTNSLGNFEIQLAYVNHTLAALQK